MKGDSMGSFRRPAFLWLMAVLAAFAARPAVAEEAILDFRSRIVVNADATLTVTETLRVRAEGRAIRHGIFRAFPTLYRDRQGRQARVAFELLEVRRDGAPEPFRVEATPTGAAVTIGDAGVLLAPGVHTYALTYRTDRQIGHFADYDELYWNVSGGDWALPRLRVEAVVVLPFNPEVIRRAAYTGRAGERGQDFTIDQDANDDIRVVTTRPLGPGEDLTIAVAWPKGYVAEPSAAERAWAAAGGQAGGLIGGAGLLAFLAVSWVLWRRVGRDPRRGLVMRLSAPPKGLSPAALRFVAHGGFDDKAFAATLLHLAVKGTLAIEAAGGAFTLRAANLEAAGLSAAEKRLLAALFGDGGGPLDLAGGYQPRVGAARAALAASLKAEYGRALFSANRRYLVPGGLITLATLVAVIATAPSSDDAAGAVLLTAMATVILAVFGRAGLGKWKAALTLPRDGRRAFPLAVTGTVLVAAAGGMAAFAAAAALERLAPAAFAAVLLLMAGNVLFVRLMAAPTVAGRKLMDAIEGFRLHLSAAAPPLSAAEFERFLPYALALDLEDAWAERFAAAVDGAGTPAAAWRPHWYAGPPWLDRSDGPAPGATLAGNLTDAVSASATAPGSAEGGGGSGGGGSAGGGGGGGGGGGW